MCGFDALARIDQEEMEVGQHGRQRNRWGESQTEAQQSGHRQREERPLRDRCGAMDTDRRPSASFTKVEQTEGLG
jgi:hypothetical protein